MSGCEALATKAELFAMREELLQKDKDMGASQLCNEHLYLLA
jgi:hypothetical protein